MTTTVIEQDSFTIENEHQMRGSFTVLNQMRKKGELCDVALVAKNVEISAHKCVLASSSPYFYSMFTNFEFSKEQKIPMDVDPQILTSVINYMYTSKLIVQKANVKELLEIANMLLLQSIQNECRKILERIIDANSCLGIKVVSTIYGDAELLATTLSYIDEHFVDVIASREFLNLTKDQLSEFISRDTLRVPCEETVYECVVKWINHDPKGRRKHLRSLMGFVRLAHISKGYLKKHIVDDSFLRGDSYCKDLIINALLEDNTVTKTKAREYKKISKILLAIGGFIAESRNKMEYYDFEKGKWSELLEIPFEVCYASVAAVHQKVYVLGGERDCVEPNAVNVYDTTTKSWHTIDSMTTKRVRHGVAILNNCIYTVGGSTSNDGNVLNSGEKFDLKTQKWTPIAPMFTKKRGLGVVVLNETLYAVGGFDGDNTLSSLKCYNQHTNSWKNLCSMNEARTGLGACALDGKIYAIGGWIGMKYTATVEVYDPDQDIWTKIKPMSVARALAGVAVLDNRIYVVGGQNGTLNTLTSVEVYDKSTNQWTMLPETMNVGRSCHAVIIINNLI